MMLTVLVIAAFIATIGRHCTLLPDSKEVRSMKDCGYLAWASKIAEAGGGEYASIGPRVIWICDGADWLFCCGHNNPTFHSFTGTFVLPLLITD